MQVDLPPPFQISAQPPPVPAPRPQPPQPRPQSLELSTSSLFKSPNQQLSPLDPWGAKYSNSKGRLPSLNLTEVTDEDAERLKFLLKSADAKFKSTAQYYIYKALTRRDGHIMAVLPTGGGKSLPIQLAALTWPEEVVIAMVLPHIALIEDQERSNRNRGISCSRWSMANRSPQEKIILIAMEHISWKECRDWLGGLAQSNRLGALVIDEAYKLCLDKTWRPKFENLIYASALSNTILVLLSATIPPQYEHKVWDCLELAVAPKHIIRTPTDIPNISHQVIVLQSLRSSVQADNSDFLLNCGLKVMQEYMPHLKEDDRAIIFCTSVNAATKMAEMLGCQSYTGPMDLHDRTTVFNNWRAGAYKAITATSAFNSGIDFARVRLILHLGKPVNIEDYVQGEGRGGRDGLPTLSLTLLNGPAQPKKTKVPDPFDGDQMLCSAFADHEHCRRTVRGLAMDSVGVTCFTFVEVYGVEAALCDVCLRSKPPISSSPFALLNNTFLSTPHLIHPSYRPLIKAHIGPAPVSALAPSLPLPAPYIRRALPPMVPLAPTPLDMQVARSAAQVRQEKRDSLTTQLAELLESIKTGKQTCILCWACKTDALNHSVLYCPMMEKALTLQPGEWLPTVKRWKKDEVGFLHACCFKCTLPSFGKTFHQGEAAGKGDTLNSKNCLYDDYAPHLAWLVCHNKPWREGLLKEAGQQQMDQKTFVKWVKETSGGIEHNNFGQVILWVKRYRESKEYTNVLNLEN